MPSLTFSGSLLKKYLRQTGALWLFAGRFFREASRRPFEWQEFLNQCYQIGNKSLFLVSTTGFILGMVLTLQTRPTMVDFGAAAYIPSMVGISIIREIGPVVTALICAGKIGSGIGAELGSMKVTEQIAAMEVSGTNPFKYLVATRILAATLMVPLLAVMADGVSLLGSFLIEHYKGDVSFRLFFNQVYRNLSFGDLVPAKDPFIMVVDGNGQDLFLWLRHRPGRLL